MDTSSSRSSSVALMCLLATAFTVSGFSTLTYSCFTLDGKHRIDSCRYFSYGDDPIDVNRITVGCCVHTNTTAITRLSCAVGGSFCPTGSFVQIFPDADIAPPSRAPTTRASSTSITTSTTPGWYRQTTNSYRWSRRTTTQYRPYRRPTTSKSYRITYRNSPPPPPKYSSSYNIIRILKIAGGLCSAVLLMIAICGYCSRRRNAADAGQTDNPSSLEYLGTDAIPMTTRSNGSNSQISADGTQEVTSSVDDNVYPSWYAGTEEETESGAVCQQRSTDRNTVEKNGETILDLPSVPPPSYSDVTKPIGHRENDSV